MAARTGSMGSNTTASAGAQDETVDQHEQGVENHEAFQYWGYLFKADKTGTDKLKSLLRGLKDVMNTNYEPSDNPDLTPNQLAHFYRELHGNYDQLFLGTPSESIAFIYKSLGCLHSLQPLPHSAFTDPTIPALKTEGWIMWQTIQLLLGPEEHSSFLVEAVQKWDVKDPTTGEVFPKILPRKCFPAEPDKHMVAWYEGVSERLRREAEDEERQREIEAEQAEVRRLQDRKRDDTDDEGSVDSRGPALAYFRNPLYRHVDGRPSIVRRSSKRPALSPRPTMVDKGKEAASSVGHVIRNIGSPHLWDGRKSESRERDRDRRRRSLPDNRYSYGSEQPPSAGYDSRPSNMRSNSHQRHPSVQMERPDTGTTEDSEDRPMPSERPGSRPHHYRDGSDTGLKHSRSHEPTPSQKEYGDDYFAGYENSSRRNSAQAGTPLESNGIGPSFAPSASPLFASHIAKQPQPPAPRPPPPGGDPYGPRRSPPQHRRPSHRPYSRSPDPHLRPRDSHDRDRDRHRDSRYSSRSPRRHSRQDRSPGRHHHDGPTSAPAAQPGFPPIGSAPGDPERYGGPPPGSAPPYPDSRRQSMRGARTSASDVSGGDDRDRDRERRNGGKKQARFAAGVDGRRYPNESPWR